MMATITIAIVTSISVKPRRAGRVVVMSAPGAEGGRRRRLGAVERHRVLFRRVVHRGDEDLVVRETIGEHFGPRTRERDGASRETVRVLSQRGAPEARGAGSIGDVHLPIARVPRDFDRAAIAGRKGPRCLYIGLYNAGRAVQALLRHHVADLTGRDRGRNAN